MFDRAATLQIISDMSKDAYGYRVRLDYNSMSDEDLESTANSFQSRIEENIEMDARNQAAAMEHHNTEIAKLMEDHGITRKTALRWDMEAYDVNGDRGFYCYKKGLPFSYEHSPDWESFV